MGGREDGETTMYVVVLVLVVVVVAVGCGRGGGGGSKYDPALLFCMDGLI